MRIDKVYIKRHKNLVDFNIDLNQNQMKTVLLGQNATGKSNFIEALILIFKYLDLSTESKRLFPGFDFQITYRIGSYSIDVESKMNKYNILIDGQNIKSLKDFFSKEGKQKYQPKYVFTYYSGLSNKLKEHFWDHQNKFYEEIIKEDFKEDNLDLLRKLFYVQLVHSYFVLLAYFSFEDEEKESIEFLNSVLHIKDIDSILFVLKKPDWAKNRKESLEDIFWTAKGLVRNFLDKLWDCSISPIYNHEDIRTDFRTYDPQDRLYLFIKDKKQLKALAENYKSNTEFFKALESTYISKLISEVRIKVRKEDVDGSVTFKELSEGEQQLLTVLGLLKFTKDEDSLILLDEPDTHLNPIWKWRYIEFLDKVVNHPDTTQIIINTHDPLLIGSLMKEEVRIFRIDENGKIYTEEPSIDPKGLGVEGILTSELFGLPTTLDEETQQDLDKRNVLLIKQQEGNLTDTEQIELNTLFHKLDELGFSSTFRDPLYQKFIVASKDQLKNRKKNYTKEELDAQDKMALEILEELKKEEEKP
ncbi:MAG TPA: ATP-binding protein [Ferruginibacter sp.]|nr:ATP-binding protein [Ferruginibacter sp.]